MSLALECRKVKRTGFVSAFIGGGFLAAAVPLLSTAARSTELDGIGMSPVTALLNDNWQITAMLNVLLLVTGACIIYHIEYANNAVLKMNVLPQRKNSLFFSKLGLILIMAAAGLVLETAGVGLCVLLNAGFSGDMAPELFKNLGFVMLLTVPAALLALIIAAACKNMWTALGIGVVCVFIATMIPMGNFALSLFPFALPFQFLSGLTGQTAENYMLAAAAETVLLCHAELMHAKIRRPAE